MAFPTLDGHWGATVVWQTAEHKGIRSYQLNSVFLRATSYGRCRPRKPSKSRTWVKTRGNHEQPSPFTLLSTVSSHDQNMKAFRLKGLDLI